MGINRNLKRNHKWVLAQLVVQFNPSPLQSPDAICFKGTPNLLGICSGKPVWGREFTVEPPSKQAHKHNLVLQFIQPIRKFDLHFLYFWSSVSQSTYCREWMVYARNCYYFHPVSIEMEKEIHRTQDTEHLNRGSRIPLVYQRWSMCSQDANNNKTMVNI